MTMRDRTQQAALVPEFCEDVPLRLPVIHVRIEPDEVAAFSRETGSAGSGDFVPLTFPFRWLALPAIRGGILQLIGAEGVLPVHEAQSFAYERSLHIGEEYVVAVEMETVEDPSRIILKMAVSTKRGGICVRLETVLRLVPLNLETPS